MTGNREVCMKSLSKLQWVLLLLVLSILASGCGTAAAPQTENSRPQSNTDSGGAPAPAQNANNGNPNRVSIPSSPRVAPADVLDQVAFEGSAGGGGDPVCPCIDAYNNMLHLDGFEPNQTLRLVAYDEYTLDHGQYVADWSLTVDSSGSLSIPYDGELGYVFIAFDPASGRQVGPATRRVKTSQ